MVNVNIIEDSIDRLYWICNYIDDNKEGEYKQYYPNGKLCVMCDM
jgi:antitoxin component YwqK of YwqJK toxin-antitoxin module